VFLTSLPVAKRICSASCLARPVTLATSCHAEYPVSPALGRSVDSPPPPPKSAAGDSCRRVSTPDEKCLFTASVTFASHVGKFSAGQAMWVGEHTTERCRFAVQLLVVCMRCGRDPEASRKHVSRRQGGKEARRQGGSEQCVLHCCPLNPRAPWLRP
jgi:hypothetical protein